MLPEHNNNEDLLAHELLGVFAMLCEGILALALAFESLAMLVPCQDLVNT